MGPNWVLRVANPLAQAQVFSCLQPFIACLVRSAEGPAGLGPGHGHAAMCTASQPRKAPPRAAPLGSVVSGSRQRVGHR